MHDSEVTERRLKEAFAGVRATPGVDTWRHRTPRAHRLRGVGRAVTYGIRPRLLEVALTAGIAAALLVVSVAGTIALSHSRATPPVSAHSSAVPATTKTPSPAPTATASACSRLQTPTSMYGFGFDPPGSANPPISCSKAIATLRCPPQFVAGNPCDPVTGPITAELVRLSATGPLGEVRASGGPYAGPPFFATNLLAWRLTFVPTLCTADATGVSGSDLPPFHVFFHEVPTRCGVAEDYLIDAATGYFVFFDAEPTKKG